MVIYCYGGIKSIMKKVLFALILLIAAMGYGCNDNTENNLANSTQPDYVVNIDNSFDSGIERETVRETLSPEESDFRNLKWGMTKDEVMYVEGAGAREINDNVLYYTRVREEDFPADAEYTFVNDKLAQGIFYITENKDGNSICLDDYDSLVNSFKNRYGEPSVVDRRFASDDLKTDDRNELMNLVMTNQFNYKTGWTNNNTDISVILFQKDNLVCIGLRYKDTNVTIDG